MTDRLPGMAGPRAARYADRSSVCRELPIPFGAFIASSQPAPVELIQDTLDDAAGPKPGCAADTARTPAAAAAAAPNGAALGEQTSGREGIDDAQLVAPHGRAILAVGPALTDHAAAEQLATQLCARISRRPPEDRPILQQHAPADDLAHWAEVDALRATLVAEVGLVICAHDVTLPGGRVLITIDVPERHADRVIRTVDQLPGAWIEGVLTDQGWARQVRRTRDPVPDAAVHRSAQLHAYRRSGRALVFPGQAALQRDVPVAAVLSESAVETVHNVHGDYAPDARLRCHGYARPHYQDGRLTLAVTHDDPQLLVTVEVRYSPPCCAGER